MRASLTHDASRRVASRGERISRDTAAARVADDTFSHSRAMNQILISEIVSRTVPRYIMQHVARFSTRQVEVKFKLPSRKTTQPREVTRLR